MQAIDEGAGTTLLDNLMLPFGSNMVNGDSHDGRNLLLVLAEQGGSTIASAINFSDSVGPREGLR
ncbi:MAG: hypothetical protein R3C01_05105 [Planctomycetaceae bacterium]